MTEPTEPIYADHAATTPLDPEAFAAMRPWLTDQYANPAALYRSGLAARRAVEQARRTVAACLGCAPHQIFFTSGGSEGNTWAILNGAGRPGPGSREVVTTGIEHHSVSGACAFLQKQGVTVCTVPVDAAGQVVPAALQAALARRPRLVSVQYANNEVGVIQDIPALAAQCAAAGVPLHVDAVQAAGHLELSLANIDYLTASAHKFGGPKGIGFLYVRQPAALQPLIFGGSQQGGLRPGTEPVAQIVGLARALELTCARRAESAAAKRALAADFCRTLRAGWPQARFHSTVAGLPGLVSVGLPGFDGQALTYRLDLAGVCVSPGAACDNTGRSHPSHVLLALGGTAAEDALCTLRFSFGAANRPGHGAEAARRLLQALQNPTIQPH